jgi:hypothetical protein
VEWSRAELGCGQARFYQGKKILDERGLRAGIRWAGDDQGNPGSNDLERRAYLRRMLGGVDRAGQESLWRMSSDFHYVECL